MTGHVGRDDRKDPWGSLPVAIMVYNPSLDAYQPIEGHDLNNDGAASVVVRFPEDLVQGGEGLKVHVLNQSSGGGGGGGGLRYRGAWSNSASYTTNDVVTHGGRAWAALRDNSGVTPAAGADWGLLVEKGDPGAKGDPGVKGDQGLKGDPGPGVPVGGATGQVLSKKSGTDFDTQWTPSGGGGGATTANIADITMWMDAANLTLTNLPLAGVEIGANFRTRRYVDLSSATQFRVGGVLVTASTIAAKIRVEYSLDNGTTWAALKDATATTDPDMPLSGAIGARVGAWTPIITAARVASVLLRGWAYAGDGVVDPVIAALYAQFK